MPKRTLDYYASIRSYDVAWHDELGQIMLDGPYPDSVNFKVRQTFDSAFDDISGVEKAAVELIQNAEAID